MDERNSQSLGIRTEILQVRLIRNVRHRNVYGNYREPRFEDEGTLRQQFQQGQGILSSRQTYQNLVVVINETVLHHPLVEPLPYSAHQLVFFGKFCHILPSNRVQNYTKRMILEKIKEIELNRLLKIQFNIVFLNLYINSNRH